MVPRTWLDELGIELVGVHGKAAALAHGGQPTQATVVAIKARVSSTRWRGTQKGEKEGRRGIEELRLRAGHAQWPWRGGGGNTQLGSTF
jgi:hypothetical protein